MKVTWIERWLCCRDESFRRMVGINEDLAKQLEAMMIPANEVSARCVELEETIHRLINERASLWAAIEILNDEIDALPARTNRLAS